MRIDLSSEERDLLDRVLQSTVTDLRSEISRTDSYRFRQSLKHEEETLRALIRKVEAPPQTEVAAF